MPDKASIPILEPGVCRVCACTETTPCVTDDGPCAWADEAQTICTPCAETVITLAQFLLLHQLDKQIAANVVAEAKALAERAPKPEGEPEIEIWSEAEADRFIRAARAGA